VIGEMKKKFDKRNRREFMPRIARIKVKGEPAVYNAWDVEPNLL